MTLAKTQNAQKLTADSRRFTQIRIRRFHRRDAEYAEQIPFAQSGDDDWAKAYSSNLSNVFVCRRLPTNKNLILCALCASAVIFLKGFLSVSICVNLRLIASDSLALCALLLAPLVPLRESSFIRLPKRKFKGIFKYDWLEF
jgi:hypothetical protein